MNEAAQRELMTRLAAIGCTTTQACVSTYLWIGNRWLQIDQPGSAANAFEQATRRAPTNVEAWMALGRSASRVGMQNRAREAFKKVKSLRPETPGIDKLISDESNKLLNRFPTS